MGASGGGIGEGPGACPFVALEFDRDGRSDSPDYRHRCYAEPTPAPRAIAHQEAYCLSPNFSACPVFQDWARRAAARPVSGTGLDADAATVPAAAAAAVAAEMPDDAPAAADEAGPADEAEPADEAGLPVAGEVEAAAVATSAEDGVDEPAGPEQLAAFAAPDDAETPVPPPRPEWSEEESALDWEAEEAERHDEPESDVAPVPPFLAGRPEPEPSASPGRAPRTSKVKRQDVVPSWAIDGRYGAEPPDGQPRDRFGGAITALAVLLILGLGVAGVIYLPGLLAGGGPPAPTPTSSIGTPTDAPPTAQGSLPATEAPTLAPTATPTDALPTATPGPQASPIAYRVQAGDSLRRIARRHGVTVEEILAINPDISDPNHIEVGQRILIPQPAEP